MKVRFLFAAIPLLFAAASAYAQVGAPSPTDPPINVVISESTGTVFVNGNAVPPAGLGPDGVPLYPTGGIFVFAGDIYYNEPGTSDLSDMIRIYPSAGAYGDVFSVWSDPAAEDEIDTDIFDAPFPAGTPLGGMPSLDEPGPYFTNAFGSLGQWEFQSDLETPEPASLGLLGLGTLALVNRRRKA